MLPALRPIRESARRPPLWMPVPSRRQFDTTDIYQHNGGISDSPQFGSSAAMKPMSITATGRARSPLEKRPFLYQAASGEQGRKRGARLLCSNLSTRHLNFTVFVVTFSVAVALVSASKAAIAESPLKNATAVWNMADANGRTAEHVQLTAEGDVKLGVSLADVAREASLRRGGDGQVARFDGRHLVAEQDAAEPLELRGEKMTFCIRLRDPSGEWKVPLFARETPDDPFGRILYAQAISSGTIGTTSPRAACCGDRSSRSKQRPRGPARCTRRSPTGFAGRKSPS
jgi:hypothetical protein